NVAGYAGIARNIANLAGDFGIGSNAYAAGNAAGVVGGLAQGGAQGYGSAAVNATELAGREGYITSPTVNNVAGYAGGALQLYSGIKQGGVVGDTNAAVGAATIATKAGYLGGASGALGEAIPYASAVLGVYNFATQDTKSGATGQDALGGAETGAETGASIGSIIPGIGTAIGAVVGGVIGGVAGAVSSAFGPGAMDPENVNWNNYASAYDSNPKSVAGATPTQAYQTLAGIFDARGSNLPFYQKFGRMGENRFTTAMTQQINNAVKSGQISTSSTPQQIYSTVVQPWISSMSPNGWQPTNTEKGAAEQPAVGNLLTQMIGQYQQGQQGSWTGVGGQQPFLNMPGFGNTASA
ncbi:MAG: hypothetical protein ACRD22_22435, partial [Terriglobia bacterium]